MIKSVSRLAKGALPDLPPYSSEADYIIQGIEVGLR